MLFTGNSNIGLAKKVAKKLDIKMSDVAVGRFSDGEISVRINENVRGSDVYILQSISHPANDNLMELLLIADAMRRASALKITAVVPYFGYARQDRRPWSARVPISAKLVADMLTVSGIDRVLTVDLHAEQLQGFFNCQVDNVYTTSILADDIKEQNIPDPLIVSPDVGGVVRARALAKQLRSADLAIIDKRRDKANQCEIMHVIGDVDGRMAIIVDDILDTAGTLCQAAQALKEKGATKVFAYITHSIFSGNALSNIDNSVLDEVVTIDTIPVSKEILACNRIRRLSIDVMLAKAISRVSTGQSLSELFVEKNVSINFS